MSTGRHAGGRAASRGGRSWLGTILVVLLLMAAVGAAGFFGYSKYLRSSEPYASAFKQASEDPKLIEALGKPITEVYWLPSVQGGNRVRINFKVAGPRDTAEISADARKMGGTWGLIGLDANVLGSQKRLVLSTGAGDEGEAPKFGPAPSGSSTPAPPSSQPQGPPSITLPAPGDIPEQPAAQKPAAPVSAPSMKFDIPSIEGPGDEKGGGEKPDAK